MGNGQHVQPWDEAPVHARVCDRAMLLTPQVVQNHHGFSFDKVLVRQGVPVLDTEGLVPRNASLRCHSWVTTRLVDIQLNTAII